MKFHQSLSTVLVFGFFMACQPGLNQVKEPAAKPTPPSAQPAVPPATAPKEAASVDSGVLAKINGQPITDTAVTERIKDRLKKIEAQIYDIKKSGLDDMIEEKLLEMEAAKRKVSVDDLLKQEVEKKIEEPTDSEIDAFYSIYKKRLKNKPLSEVKGELIKQIKNNKKTTSYSKFIAQIKKDAKVEIFMTRPRLDVSVDDDPSKGNPKAPITIVEFSEYQCPFCKKARPIINEILETYKDKVFYVFRDFPLSFHKQAKKAAEAAQCAGDQKKYWEYADLLWEHQGDQEPDNLKKFAKEAGLNEKKFNDCLSSGKYGEEIEKDIEAGSKVGVSGTPAYFINGIMLSGAQPVDKFKEIIDEELEAAEK